MYKLVALDIDGTLLNTKWEITRKTKEAIKQASAKGTHIVVSSARPYRSLIGIAEQLELGEVPVIAAGGSDLRMYPSGEVLHRVALGKRDIKRCIEFCHRHKQYFQVFRFDGSYYFEKETEFSKIYESRFYKGEEADFENWEWEDCSSFMVTMKDEDIDDITLAAEKEMLREYLIVKIWYNMLEFHPKNGGKGAALTTLAARLNIDKADIIAVGDDTIDIPMLRSAGLAVAMGNACDALKEVADYIAPTNDEDGVAEIIKRFVLNT